MEIIFFNILYFVDHYRTDNVIVALKNYIFVKLYASIY
jgi:hypothetical protein